MRGMVRSRLQFTLCLRLLLGSPVAGKTSKVLIIANFLTCAANMSFINRDPDDHRFLQAKNSAIVLRVMPRPRSKRSQQKGPNEYQAYNLSLVLSKLNNNSKYQTILTLGREYATAVTQFNNKRNTSEVDTAWPQKTALTGSGGEACEISDSAEAKRRSELDALKQQKDHCTQGLVKEATAVLHNLKTNADAILLPRAHVLYQHQIDQVVGNIEKAQESSGSNRQESGKGQG